MWTFGDHNIQCYCDFEMYCCVVLCTYHLLPNGSTPGEWYIFGTSFFPSRGGELFIFGNFAGHWGHTHGIWSNVGQRFIARDLIWNLLQVCDPGREQARWNVLYLVPWLMCENEQKAFKKLDTLFFNFCQWKVSIMLWSGNKWLKKIVLLFLTTSYE